ncbi:hypothetical protein [Pyrobaculum neutrophilum]|uniref:Uncharacterized protein n=1 Tax=Pyrobaculum neutrophilum (strain DSM 2338 / JCM 9278 / NBRC 100436 / V24Sta) TaxID=444157 RepID=B1YDK6_PYRNV|nr:hypothetical protein [Pyrobaculum neutrophilum]ACB39869.1 conserved hypothetical protein [Pyrobaculum neutrophilum V24Sta]
MERKVIPVIALAALAALAQAASVNATADFHLWLKCKAIELYINTTGANFTLPQCDALLAQLNKTYVVTAPTAQPLPMIGVGELKMLNVSDPKAVFQQIREIRLAAIKELGKHLNRTVDRVYANINASADIENATEGGLRALMRVRALLGRVNASRAAVEAVDRNIERLRLLREVYMYGNATAYVAGRVNLTDRGLEEAIDHLERVLARARELQEHFEKLKLAQLAQVVALRAHLINETISLLTVLKTLPPEMRGDAVRAIAAHKWSERYKVIDDIMSRAKGAAGGGASGEGRGSGAGGGGGQVSWSGGMGGQGSGGGSGQGSWSGSGGWSGGQGSGGGSGSGQGSGGWKGR